MIVEGIVTTWDVSGRVNVAPLGPMVPEDRPPCEWNAFLLRPFPGSRTYANLKATRHGVFHLTDDVLLVARAAVEDVAPPLRPTETIEGSRLADCCHWFEFRVAQWGEADGRPSAAGPILRQGVGREWTGFNRAKHAVLEAAILATRLHLTGKEAVLQEFERLKAPIEKTAGPAEREAFAFLMDYVQRWNGA